MERKKSPGALSSDTGNRALLEACSEGDDRALQLFYDRYKNLIYSAIHAWMNSNVQEGEVDRREHVEELFQEAFLTLMENDFALLMSARDPERISGLLYVIVYRMTGRYFRDRRREDERKSGQSGSDIGVNEDPLDRLSEEEAAVFVGDFLRGLPPADRQILELFYDRGLRYREIGDQLGLTTTNVGVKISRLKDRLRKYLIDRLGSEAELL